MPGHEPSLPHRQPVFNAPPTTIALCAALVIVHVGLAVAPPDVVRAAYGNLAFVPARWHALIAGDDTGAARTLLSLVGHAFLHGDFLHLLVNGGLLLAFGSVVERRLGRPGILIVFFGCAAAGALTEAWALGPAPVPMIGASGATYGAIGAAVPLLFGRANRQGRRQGLIFIAVIMGVNLVFGAFGFGSLIAGAEIAWQAHIGGFVAGLAIAILLSANAPRGGRR